MQQYGTVAIVGVGLIGGSIGLALRQRGLSDEVVGIGRRAESLDLARHAGAVTRTTVDLAEGVAQAELVVVCTPVEQIVPLVRAAAAGAPTALITDAGSTKARIVADLAADVAGGLRFVGSHPLAGSEKRGPAEARGDLFEGRVTIVAPDESTRSDDVSATIAFWTALGSRVLTMSPARHDEILAATSHVPHVIAAALAAATPGGDLEFAAGGFRDTTRIAAGDAELWVQILLDNREHVLTALDRFERSAARFRAAIERGDRAQLAQLLAEAKQQRDALGS